MRISHSVLKGHKWEQRLKWFDNVLSHPEKCTGILSPAPNCGGLLRELGENDQDTIWSSLRLGSCLDANSGGVRQEEGPVLIPAMHPECVALTNL